MSRKENRRRRRRTARVDILEGVDERKVIDETVERVVRRVERGRPDDEVDAYFWDDDPVYQAAVEVTGEVRKEFTKMIDERFDEIVERGRGKVKRSSRTASTGRELCADCRRKEGGFERKRQEMLKRMNTTSDELVGLISRADGGGHFGVKSDLREILESVREARILLDDLDTDGM